MRDSSEKLGSTQSANSDVQSVGEVFSKHYEMGKFFFPEGRSHCAAQLLSLLREAQVASQNELGVKDAIA